MKVRISAAGLKPDTVQLVKFYAAFGTVEVRVIIAATLQTRIHRDPTPTGYRTIVDLPPTERLEPLLVPSLAVTPSEPELH
ncbi:MAG TPA: hypothetical protein VFK86_05590 [Bauldia sp.]|nr:hypothetical protein [Bauldia sp.]